MAVEMESMTVKLGDVAHEVSGHEHDPVAAGLTRFVGLDDLDPESPRIERWGMIENGTSFTKRFRAGQLLFAKRRAYQRKAAVADFDGICSGDLIVIEADADRILPEMLWFLVQTDSFFHHALRTSSGSLSPRTKWKHLADFQFQLPIHARQRQIVQVLSSVEDARVLAGDTLAKLATLRRANAAEFFESAQDEAEMVQLGDLLEGQPESGLSPAAAPGDTGLYVLTLGALSAAGYVQNRWKPVSKDNFSEVKRLSGGDLLISRSNTIEMVGFVGTYSDSGHTVMFPDLMMRLPVDDARVSSKYLEFFLQSPQGRSAIRRIAAGTSGSMKKINKTNLKKVKVPAVTVSQQNEIVHTAERIDGLLERLRDHTGDLTALGRGLREKLLIDRSAQT